MDRLDEDILRALLVNNGVPPGTPMLRRSFRSMARELHVDQGTVRNRMKRLESEGIVRGWYLGLNPNVTGDGVAYTWFSVEPDAKKRVADRLLTMRGVERVCDYMGPKLSAVIVIERGADPAVTLKEAASVAGPEARLVAEAHSSAPPLAISETDNAIIKSLRKDPWISFSSIAKELRISERTVRRRVARLGEEGLAYALPIIDLKAIHGMIPAELVVDYTSSGSRPSVNRLLESKLGRDIVFSGPAGRSGYFAFMVRNVSEVEHLAQWVARQPGVHNVTASILQDVMLNRGYYGETSAPEAIPAKTQRDTKHPGVAAR